MFGSVSKILLSLGAVKLSTDPSAPFVWASGWKCPIYCDNRMINSYTKERTAVVGKFLRAIEENFDIDSIDAIAGVATGAISWGVLVADCLRLPFAYIRSAPKDHGRENLIEGVLKPGQRVLIIEDLISTGGSSLKAVQAVRDAGCEVVGMAAIFTYGFQKSIDAFSEAGCKLVTLTDYQNLITTALESEDISEENAELLAKWSADPGNWYDTYMKK